MSKAYDPTTGSFHIKTSGLTPGAHTHAPADITPQGAGSGLNADLLDGLSSAAFQAADADLTAIAALAGTGLLAHTGAGTWAERTLTAPAAGFTITNPAGVAGNPTFVLANDLGALEGLGSTGIAVRSAADTWVQRSLTQPAAGITISNNDGVAGNPTFALANDLSALEGLASTGMAVRSAADTWVQRSLTQPAAGLTISNNDGVSGNPTFALANDLSALEGLGSTGIACRTAADTWAQRTVTGGTGVTITNPGGVAGNIDVALNLAAIDHNALLNLPTGDVHTHYLLLAGRAGGQSAQGGLTTTTDSLTLKANTGTYADGNTGRIHLDDRVSLWASIPDTLGNSGVAVVSPLTFDPTFTIDNALLTTSLVVFSIAPTTTITNVGTIYNYQALNAAGTTTFNDFPTVASWYLFNVTSILTIASAAAGARPAPVILRDQLDIGGGNVAAGTVSSIMTVMSTPRVQSTGGSGSLTVTDLTAFYAKPALFANTAGGSLTVTTRRGLLVSDPGFTATGTLTLGSNVGVDLEDMVVGVSGNRTVTNVYGIRSTLTTGTNRWFLHASTADSSIAGRIFLGGTAGTVPNTDLDVDGDLATRVAGVTLANGTNSDIAIGARSFVRITGPTGAFTTTGFASPFDGKRLVVINGTTQQWTIVNDATSTAANRIYTGDGADIVLAAAGGTTDLSIAEFVYDLNATRWRLIAARDTAGPR